MAVKLSIELVPKCLWGINMRRFKDWGKIRNKVYKKAGFKCEICGSRGKLHAHEVWEYDDVLKIQSLKNLICLCENCHAVKHLGVSIKRGRYESCVNHFVKINQIDRFTAKKMIEDAFTIWRDRNKFQWKNDFNQIINIIQDLEST